MTHRDGPPDALRPAASRSPRGTSGDDSRSEHRRLRVLVGLNRLWIAGAELNAVDLAARLSDRGHYVVVAGQEEPDRTMLDLAERRGLAVRVLPRGRTHELIRPLESTVREERIELIHMYYSKLTTAALLGPYRRWGTPVVTTEYGPGPVVTPACSHLIVGTEECAQGMRPWFGSPVSVIEPPVDICRDHVDGIDGAAFLAGHGIRDLRGPRVVIVSRLDPRTKLEGILRTIDACAALDSLGVTLIVVGGGEALSEVRRAADRVNDRLRRRAVVVTGPLPDPRAAYAAADVVVGMGGSALRGMAFAKPVVVLGTNGFALPFEPATAEYFFWHGFFGHGPVCDLESTLQRLLGDPALRGELGRFGRRTVESRYSLDIAHRRLESIYLAAVDDRPRSSRRWLTAGEALAHYTLAHYDVQGLWRSKFTQTPVAYS